LKILFESLYPLAKNGKADFLSQCLEEILDERITADWSNRVRRGAHGAQMSGVF